MRSVWVRLQVCHVSRIADSSRSSHERELHVTPPPQNAYLPALGGYCPVELVERGRLVTGDPALTLQYQGQTYQLSSPMAKKTFAQAPQRYVPPFSTYDPVQFSIEGTRTPGSVDLFVIHKDRAWFFLNENNRRRFLLSPDPYISRALSGQK
jgi:YHS domain-containing protein